MKHFVVLLLFFTTIYGYNLENEWTNFKIKYGKTYSDSSIEGKLRKKNFEENLKMIEEHNKKYEIEMKKPNPSITYKLEVTGLSDMSDAEVYMRYTSGKKMLKDQTVCKRPIKGHKFRAAAIIGQHRPITDKGNPPEEVDWRKKIQLSDIQNQGDCGCCWAFASIGAVEAHIAIKKKTFEKLSEQELVECLKTDNTDGCDGGLHYEAFDYIIEAGITPATTYPKTAKEGQCNSNRMKNKQKIIGYRFLDYTKPNEEELKKVLAFVGPVATSMATPRSVKNYGKNSGVFNDPNCNNYETDHYVLIVGYGVDPKGGPYWIIKNSWSKDWGDNGYMKLARNKGNMCYIASEVFYPIV